MTPLEVAAEYEAFASEVMALPGLGRNNLHAFAEAKDALARKMMRRALDLRTVPARGPRPAPMPAGRIETGIRRIGDRCVPVERRGRRA